MVKTRSCSKDTLDTQEEIVQPAVRRAVVNLTTRSRSKRELNTQEKDLPAVDEQIPPKLPSRLASQTQTRSQRMLNTQEKDSSADNRGLTRGLTNLLTTASSSKRKLNTREEDPPSVKRCFTNLTNFKSPKSRKDCRKAPSSGNKMTQYFSPIQKTQSTSLQVEEPVPMSQSIEISVSQVPLKDVPGNSKEEVISMLQGIKKALEDNFKDVTDRLQLQAVPSFLYDLKAYQINCSNTAKIDLTKCESEYMARNFLTDDRHFLFINYVRNSILGQKEFPGVPVIRGILELIMRITDEEVNTLGIKAQQSINELYSLFNSILMTFPHSSLRSSYLKLFESAFNFKKATTKIKGKLPRQAQPGVLQTMLSLLTDLIQRDDSKAVTKSQSSSQDNINNFFLWDAHNEEKLSFEHFERDEKFERIFTVLDLITTVLENDLASFIVKYSKLPTCIDNSEQCPLIYSILWQHEGPIGINELVKNIVSIFVSTIALNYPSQKVQVLARLVNLLSHVINLFEYSAETEYPCFKSTSMNLVQEILKAVESSAYYSIDLVTAIASNLRSPLTQMLFVNQVVQKIHNSAKPISLEIPFDLIRKKEFLKFKNILTPPKTENSEKYPVKDGKRKTVPYEVNQRSYLKLLEIYTRSVNSFYRIQAGLVEIKMTKQSEAISKPCATLSIPLKAFNFDEFKQNIKTVNLDEEVKLRKVDMTFKKLIIIRLSKESCVFYRAEIKHFLLLPKLITKCHEKYGGLFDDWMNLMQQMEVKV